MSSPGSDGSKTTSFEDAENENPAAAGGTEAQAAPAFSGTAGEGIKLTDDDILYLLSGGKGNPANPSTPQPQQPPHPPKLPSPPRVTRNPGGGAGACTGSSSVDRQTQRGSHTKSPPRPATTGGSATEVSPSAKGNPTQPRRRTGSVYEDNPPSLAPKGGASQKPQSSSGYGTKTPEPAIAVGVGNVDIDTASLSRAGDTDFGSAHRGGSIRDLCCWFCNRYETCSRCCQWARCSRIVTATRTLFAVSVIAAASVLLCVAHFVVSPYVDHKIKKALVLRPGFEEWQRPRASIVADFYLFNVSNPEQFMENGQIPVLKQFGPYSFRVGVEKINISWNDNGTVSYRELYTFRFDQNKSSGSQNDHITTANFPLLIIDDYMGPSSVFINSFLSKKASRLVESHSIQELIWGYHSPVFDEVKKIVSWAPLRYFHLAEDLPSTMEALSKDNSSVSRMYNVYTGADNFSQLNDVYSWDYHRKLPFWTTEEANEIKGTDGSAFKPFLKKDSKVSVFLAQLFRSFQLEYQKSHSLRGLEAFRFIVPDSQFFNSSLPTDSQLSRAKRAQAPSVVPSKHAVNAPVASMVPTPFGDPSAENKKKSIKEADNFEVVSDSLDKVGDHKSGFCVPECVPNGVYSIEPCTAAPLYISLPHFLGADPFYLSQVSGLEPQEDKHRPIFDVDSLTGVLISTKRRYQLNVRVNAGKSEDTFLPVLWVDLQANLDRQIIERMRLASHAKKAVFIVIVCTAGLIAILFCITCGLILHSCCTNTERSRYRPLL